jgi:hypothetical protein
MKNKNLLLITLCIIGLLIIPRAGSAKMVAMTDDRLSEVTGQAGIVGDTSRMAFDKAFDNVPVLNNLLDMTDVPIRGPVMNQISRATDIDATPALTPVVFDSHFDTMPMLNNVLNLCDVTMQGSVINRVPYSSDITVSQIANQSLPGFGMTGFGLMGLGSMGLGTHKIDTTINVDRFSVGAIRVGKDTTGPSLGNLEILNMKMDIVGTISITAR